MTPFHTYVLAVHPDGQQVWFYWAQDEATAEEAANASVRRLLSYQADRVDYKSEEGLIVFVDQDSYRWMFRYQYLEPRPTPSVTVGSARMQMTQHG